MAVRVVARFGAESSTDGARAKRADNVDETLRAFAATKRVADLTGALLPLK